MPLTSGTRLGPYEIVAPLGAGGMGEVYRARDARLGRDIAIKVLPEHLSSPDVRSRFEREARIASQLNHPNICTLHDVGRDGGVDYLVMELIDGETLAARLERGPLPIHDLLAAGIQIATALSQAHRAGLVHRDLKPGNLMMTGSGIKLLDFGLARPAVAPVTDTSRSQAPTVNQPLTMAGALVGTFQYMAPEQLEGQEADERTDLFALGCVLYEMATGRRPFPGNDRAAIFGAMLRDTPELVTRLNPAMPRALEPIIGRCLEKDPAARFAAASDVGDALAALQGWARREGLPELARIADRIMVLEEGPDSWTAFQVAREIEKLAPDDPMLQRLRADYSSTITIRTDPPGAVASACFYGAPDGEWLELGPTPLEGIRYPRGLTRLRLALPGYRDARDVIWSLSPKLNNATAGDGVWHYALRRPDELPSEMEPVPAGEFGLYLPGLDHLKPEPTTAFLMDRDPVTNRGFKRFVDDAGYTRRELWREPFLDGGNELTWDQAMARFVDATGRPGPATWEMGEYHEGEDEHPVAGVSWHEAAAYAAWCDGSLPTVFHWSRVAFTFASSQIAPLANLSGRGTVPIGGTRSENRFGCRDLAGNVREWTLNPINRPGERFILGGGWNDAGYAFCDAYAQPAFDRSPANGFRCMRAIEPDPNRANLARTIDVPFRDFRAETPVPDDIFRFFLRQFQYDKTPLDASLVSDQPSPLGRWQTVRFAAAYGGERLTAHVFLPARGTPPYQTVVLFPGSLAIHARVFDPAEIRRTDFVLKSGRALVLPVYKGTYERGGELVSDYPEETTFYKDYVVMWGKDLSRTIDYIETRSDLDASRVAFYGTSWGGALGAILPAVEPRLRANVLYVAGLQFQRALPEADQINYLPRVTQPTLMLNGELDFFFPAETSQVPMFDLLGTPVEHKKRLTYPRGHTVPRLDLIKESVAWLDRYLGPVA